MEGRAAWAVLPRPAAGPARPREEWADVARSPAAVAEALSTAFMILPLPKIETLCRCRPGLEAWVAGERGAGARPSRWCTWAEPSGNNGLRPEKTLSGLRGPHTLTDNPDQLDQMALLPRPSEKG